MAKKIKPTHYSTVKLDIERWLGYTWGDIEELSNILKLDLLGENGMLLKAAQQNPRALNFVLLHGLQHWSPQLKYEQVQDLVQEYLNAGGKIVDLNDAIQKAMRVGGFLGDEAGPLPTQQGPVGPGHAGESAPAGAVGPTGEAPRLGAPLAVVPSSPSYPTE